MFYVFRLTIRIDITRQITSPFQPIKINAKKSMNRMKRKTRPCIVVFVGMGKQVMIVVKIFAEKSYIDQASTV